MCASHREGEEAAAGAALRDLEEQEEARLASASLAAGDPTSWFDPLYAAGARGDVPVPWNAANLICCLFSGPARGIFAELASARLWLAAPWAPMPNTSPPWGSTPPASTSPAQPSGSPGSVFPVRPSGYVVADVLDYPEAWLRAYDLVIEIITVQALPDPPRHQAIANISRLAGPGGTLLAIAAVHDDTRPRSPATVATATRRDRSVRRRRTQPGRIDIMTTPGQPDERRWLAELRRH